LLQTLRKFPMDKDTLYYDGACPLCSAEIEKLAKFADSRLNLKDIHALNDGEAGLDKALLLSRLHLQTADGEWITGLSATIRAWQHTRFRLLWRLLDWPVIDRFSRWCYEAWLRGRNRSARAPKR
jgi:predicted DCC family thiol-disulfide oxidoreductase YuxK